MIKIHETHTKLTSKLTQNKSVSLVSFRKLNSHTKLTQFLASKVAKCEFGEFLLYPLYVRMCAHVCACVRAHE